MGVFQTVMGISGVGILGNGKGKLRSWWMPRWCVYVRMGRMLDKVYILKNTKVAPVLDLFVVVYDDEVVKALGQKE